MYDVDKAAEDLMLDADLLEEVYDSFFESVRPLINECRQAIKSKNSKSIYTLIHTIKGSASNLRINEVSTIAQSIENGISTEQWIWVQGLLGDLENKVSETESIIKNYYKTKGANK